MIHEIAPHQYDNTYHAKQPKPEAIALYYEDGQALVCVKDDGISFPRIKELEVVKPDIYEESQYLFAIDETEYYLVKELDAKHFQENTEYTMEKIVLFRRALPQYRAFAGITGYQLWKWYKSHIFCGVCGTKLVPDQKERMLKCKGCGHMEYPRINPAVIIGLTDGNRILLSKYADKIRRRYALLAGYAEIGETLEETVRREVMEEVGLKVKNIRYYKSQPWSFTDTLLAGFYCELDGDDAITLDTEELELAQWFEREEVPELESWETLTNEMIQNFKDGGF